MSLQRLSGRVAELGSTPLSTQAYRHVSTGRDPRSATGARVHGGRWNPPDSFAVLYLGLDERTVIDEFYRLARRQRVPPAGFLPRELHRFDARLEAVLDLRGPEAREAVELTDRRLKSDDPALCQEIGAAAHALGLEGLVAPSAAGDGTVLAVFLDALRPNSVVEVVALETVWNEPPPTP